MWAPSKVRVVHLCLCVWCYVAYARDSACVCMCLMHQMNLKLWFTAGKSQSRAFSFDQVNLTHTSPLLCHLSFHLPHFPTPSIPSRSHFSIHLHLQDSGWHSFCFTENHCHSNFSAKNLYFPSCNPHAPSPLPPSPLFTRSETIPPPFLLNVYPPPSPSSWWGFITSALWLELLYHSVAA